MGTDVLKALALGAKAVFVGRPILWGLACEVRQINMEAKHFQPKLTLLNTEVIAKISFAFIRVRKVLAMCFSCFEKNFTLH